MGSKRQKRKKKQGDRLQEKLKQTRRINLSILRRLGIWETIKHTSLKDRILNARFPGPSVCLATSSKQIPESKELISAVKTVVNDTTFNSSLLGDSFRFTDFCVYVKPILEVIRNTASKNDKENEVLSKLRTVFDDGLHSEVTMDAMREVMMRIDLFCLMVGGIDTQLYEAEIKSKRDYKNQWRVEVALGCQRAIKKKFQDGERARYAFRCGQKDFFGKVKWLELSGQQLGFSNDALYPVYIQRHALDNLRRRVVITEKAEDREWILSEFLNRSLYDPKVARVNSENGDMLIEYRVGDYKIGYLLGSRLEDAILIRTFLFLTMNGTPEGDLLYKKLRLKRSDKEYLELDCIETFINSDVQHDSELRSLLEECGCGDLFLFAETTLDKELCKRGNAEDIRRYLKL
ncbi:MAG: hypothetical protein HUJ26_04485 [Planctomycetaceae bacterium]|nr:hypothetical protein [Planctomycetaceae bacterium]